MRALLLGNAYGKPHYSIQSVLFRKLSEYGDVKLLHGPMPHPTRMLRMSFPLEVEVLSDEFTHIWFFSTGVRFRVAKMVELRANPDLKLIALEITHRKVLEKSPLRWREVEYYRPATQNLARLAMKEGVKAKAWYPLIAEELFEDLPTQTPKYDVVFAGALAGHPDKVVRVQTLRRLTAAGLSVLHLPSGKDAPQGEEYVKLLRQARVGLHVTALAEGISRKLPEYAAAEVCPLMKVDEDTAAMLEPGVEAIDLFAPNVIDIIRNPAECRKRARAARVRALRDCTAAARVADLMEFVGD